MLRMSAVLAARTHFLYSNRSTIFFRTEAPSWNQINNMFTVLVGQFGSNWKWKAIFIFAKEFPIQVRLTGSCLKTPKLNLLSLQSQLQPQRTTLQTFPGVLLPLPVCTLVYEPVYMQCCKSHMFMFMSSNVLHERSNMMSFTNTHISGLVGASAPTTTNKQLQQH